LKAVWTQPACHCSTAGPDECIQQWENIFPFTCHDADTLFVHPLSNCDLSKRKTLAPKNSMVVCNFAVLL
jgi:hypothetical protein